MEIIQMYIKFNLLPKRVYHVIILFFFILSFPLYAAQYTEEASTQEHLYAKGRIREVSQGNQTITIQQEDGKRILVLVNAETELKGFDKIGNLHGGDIIKIWYRQDRTGNIGLKILKPPELGC
jgi:hypothetical protein